MSTSAVFARGSEWSGSTLGNGWGDITDEQAKALSDLTVERFEKLCEQAGDPSISWFPSLSEVHGHVYGQDEDEHGKFDPVSGVDLDLDELREQAIGEVWDAVLGEDAESEIAQRVAWIFSDEDEVE